MHKPLNTDELLRDLTEMDPTLSQILDRGFWTNGARSIAEMGAIGYKTDRRLDFGGVTSISKQWSVRYRFVNEYSFAIPCEEALTLIARHSSTIVEVGAGTGFWAHLLAMKGVSIVATDPEPRKAFDVAYESLDAVRAVEAYPDRDVLCVWPSLGESWAMRAAQAMAPGRTLYYVGEWRGCTADDDFHEYLEAAFDEVMLVAIPVFAAVHDNLMIYRKRSV